MNQSDDGPDPGWRDKIDRLSTWRAELTEEAIALPSTLKAMRQVIGDLQQVSSRLERATKGIEVLLATAETSGIAPLARRIEEAAADVEKQVDAIQSQLPGPNMVPVEELRRTIDAFTSLFSTPTKPPKPSD